MNDWYDYLDQGADWLMGVSVRPDPGPDPSPPLGPGYLEEDQDQEEQQT